MPTPMSPTLKLEVCHFNLVNYLDYAAPLTCKRILSYPVKMLRAAVITVLTPISGIIEALARLVFGILASPYLLCKGKLKKHFIFLIPLLHASVHPFINIINAVTGRELYNFNKHYLLSILTTAIATDRFEHKGEIHPDIRTKITLLLPDFMFGIFDKSITTLHKAENTPDTRVFSIDIAPYAKFRISNSHGQKGLEQIHYEARRAKEIFTCLSNGVSDKTYLESCPKVLSFSIQLGRNNNRLILAEYQSAPDQSTKPITSIIASYLEELNLYTGCSGNVFNKSPDGRFVPYPLFR